MLLVRFTEISVIQSLLLFCVQTTVLKVGMSCQGCVGAVKRVLGKLEGLFIADLLQTMFSSVS